MRPVAPSEARSRSFYRHRGKRWLDLALASLTLTLLAPLLLVTAALVRWRLGAPVLFEQRRTGLHGEPFTIWKFRSMRPPGFEGESDGARLDRFGRVLRSSSLDELPTLLNVLSGEMSLVGPRPLLPQYLPYYRAEELARFDVVPGLTGLAQVSGRNRTGWDRKLALDARYAHELTLVLDLSILARTATQVVVAKDVAADSDEAEPWLDQVREATHAFR